MKIYNVTYGMNSVSHLVMILSLLSRTFVFIHVTRLSCDAFTFFFFFFNDTATTEIYTLSLTTLFRSPFRARSTAGTPRTIASKSSLQGSFPKQIGRATSELQSHVNLVCRLLLEKK